MLGISYYAFLLSFYYMCKISQQKKFRPQSCCTCINITSVRFISQVIFIQKGSCQEVSYIFAKVIPVSKSLLFSRVSKHPSATIFKWFIHKATKHTNRRKSRFPWKQTDGFNIRLNFDFILLSKSISALSKVRWRI